MAPTMAPRASCHQRETATSGGIQVVRRRLAVAQRSRPGAGPLAPVLLVHRLHDLLADQDAGVEVAQLEVGVLGTELGAQLVTSGVGEIAQLAGHPAGL